MKRIEKYIQQHDSKILGQGGSGDVRECYIEGDSEKYALKRLREKKAGRGERFEIEIKTNLHTKGKEKSYKTMPMIDFDDEKYEWYISKIGIPSFDYIKNKSLIKIISLYKEFLKGIKKLHNEKIFHRDIKADNILFYKNSFRIIDFGIASNQNINTIIDLTQKYDKKQLGAKFTMAPEMRRNPAKADPLKADIYSLAKTFWSLIAKNKECFDGQYNTTNHSLEKYFDSNTIYISSLDNILFKCTDDNPEKRSDINHFIQVLDDFIWHNTPQNKGKSKDFYLSRRKSLDNLNKYIPNFSFFSFMDLNIDYFNILPDLINNYTFTYSQSDFKILKNVEKLEIIDNSYFIIRDGDICSDYLCIKDITNICLINESNIPFILFIKMINNYILFMCDNDTSDDFILNNSKLHIPKNKLKDGNSIKKYLHKKIKDGS